MEDGDTDLDAFIAEINQRLDALRRQVEIAQLEEMWAATLDVADRNNAGRRTQ